ncbi:MAG: hypothetical protein M1827_005952 [Pycnora praestabilis]|nr:MAG: hypothetical protein M1827_005952 [Pycnora praestabilis]
MPSTEAYDRTGITHFDIPSFHFHSGQSLPVKVAYRSYNPTSSKVVCIPTCYGGRINTTLNYTAGALKDYHVVVVAMLGNGESSSPSNTDDFPQKLYYQDCINAQYELLTKHLKVKELEAVIGFSMGGQQSYYWACMYPQFVKRAVVVCGSARTSQHNIAFLEGPKAALMNSVDYEDGAYMTKGTKPSRGLRAFGRAYCAWAMSAAWFRERIFETRLNFKSLEEFIVAQWEESFESWDAEDVLILARMWQMGDVGSTRKDGDYTQALESIEAKVLVMPARTDQYFPPEDSEIEIKSLKHGELAVIETIWGHIGGGGANDEDTAWMDKKIAHFLHQ